MKTAHIIVEADTWEEAEEVVWDLNFMPAFELGEVQFVKWEETLDDNFGIDDNIVVLRWDN